LKGKFLKSFFCSKRRNTNQKSDLAELNITQTKLDNCIKLAETFVDFALNKHSKVIGHIYPKQKSVSIRNLCKRICYIILFFVFENMKNLT